MQSGKVRLCKRASTVPESVALLPLTLKTIRSTMVAAQAAVDRSEMSVVTSVRNFMRSLGGTIFLVIGATIM
jgi:hypothetical protein